MSANQFPPQFPESAGFPQMPGFERPAQKPQKAINREKIREITEGETEKWPNSIKTIEGLETQCVVSISACPDSELGLNPQKLKTNLGPIDTEIGMIKSTIETQQGQVDQKALELARGKDVPELQSGSNSYYSQLSKTKGVIQPTQIQTPETTLSALQGVKQEMIPSQLQPEAIEFEPNLPDPLQTQTANDSQNNVDDNGIHQLPQPNDETTEIDLTSDKAA